MKLSKIKKEIEKNIETVEKEISSLIHKGEDKVKELFNENKSFSLEKKVKSYLEKIKKEDQKINAFLNLNENAIKEAAEIDKKTKKGKLYGKVIAVKSNINVKGLICNCASKTLENYRATFDATVIEKIKKEDGLIIGMTNMDEFASGSSGENSAFGATINPIVKGRITGGSSSGSAAAVAADFCDLALGSDTGGSIRNPASHCGIIGVKPSYGRVSRYGLIDLSMSLDQIGVFSKNAEDALLLMSIIQGKDEKDSTTQNFPEIKLQKLDNIKIGIININGIDKRIQNLIDKKIESIEKKLKWKTEKTSINHIELAVQTYYLLVYVEFFSATRRFDGRRYGKKIYQSCGKEVLRRILGGMEITKAEFRGKYYQKALQIKELIKEEFENVLKKVDCILLPTVPSIPWKVGEGNKMKIQDVYAADALTIPANLAEICAVSVDSGKVEGIPIGMQIMCAKGQEGKMLSIAKAIETLQ